MLALPCIVIEDGGTTVALQKVVFQRREPSSPYEEEDDAEYLRIFVAP